MSTQSSIADGGKAYPLRKSTSTQCPPFKNKPFPEPVSLMKVQPVHSTSPTETTTRSKTCSTFSKSMIPSLLSYGLRLWRLSLSKVGRGDALVPLGDQGLVPD